MLHHRISIKRATRGIAALSAVLIMASIMPAMAQTLSMPPPAPAPVPQPVKNPALTGAYKTGVIGTQPTVWYRGYDINNTVVTFGSLGYTPGTGVANGICVQKVNAYNAGIPDPTRIQTCTYNANLF